MASSADPSLRPMTDATLASGDIPSLNGIRALAVSLVFFAHGGLERIVPGGLGVTIFFVLSGYLITTLLRREFANSNTINLRAFYLRRILRLMPPLAIVLGVSALLASVSVIEGEPSAYGLLSVLFYVGNYYVIAHDFNGLPAGMGVVWSLAVEEHYYLLYPPLALLLMRIARPRGFIASMIALCIVILAWRCWLYWQGTSAAYISMASDTRADAILIGCLTAYWRNAALAPIPQIRSTTAALTALACVAVLLGSLIYRDEFFRQTFRYTLQSLAIAPLIQLAVSHPRGAPFRWLNSRPMVYLGTVSYTLYLSHQVLLYFVMRHWSGMGDISTLVATAALTLTAAELMRRYIETPCARWRRALHTAAPGRGLRQDSLRTSAP